MLIGYRGRWCEGSKNRPSSEFREMFFDIWAARAAANTKLRKNWAQMGLDQAINARALSSERVK